MSELPPADKRQIEVERQWRLLEQRHQANQLAYQQEQEEFRQSGTNSRGEEELKLFMNRLGRF